MNKAFLHQQTFLRRMSNTNQTSNTSSVFRMTLQSKSQNSKPSSSVCALCFHSLWRVRMQLIKVFWQLETIFHSFQLIYSESSAKGLLDQLLDQMREISSRALGGMPRSFEFLASWIIAPCFSKCYFGWNNILNTRCFVLRAHPLPFQIFGIL